MLAFSGDNDAAQMRAAAVLQHLRRDTSLTDAEVVVPVPGSVSATYRIHVAVVAPYSDFFRAALCGTFCEARERRLVLPDTSPRAVSTSLDYMYAHCVEKPLRDDTALALDVWQLAHRLQMEHLRALAARGAISGLTVRNAVEVLEHSKLFGILPETNKVLNFISRNFNRVQHLEQLDFQHITNVLGSPDLIAHEHEKFHIVDCWIGAQRSVRLQHLRSLLTYVQLQRYKPELLNQFLEHPDIPRDLLAKKVTSLLPIGLSLRLPNLLCTAPDGATYAEGSEFIFTVRKSHILRGGSDEVSKAENAALRFNFQHWALSALLAHQDGKGLFLHFRFDHRTEGDDKITLEDDCWRHTFRLFATVRGQGYSSKLREWDQDTIVPVPIGPTLVYDLLYKWEIPQYFADMDAEDNAFQPFSVVFRLQCGKVPPP